MWYQDWLIILSCFLRDINWIIVHCRRWTTCWSMSFEKQFSTACFVESNHFFLVILVILVILLTERILKMEVPMCPSVQFWVLYCWTFEISLLLNLWDSWLTCLFTTEPLNFIYCWTFEIPYCLICLLLNLWTLFTAEPLRFLSVYCWTFELCLLLNLWDSWLICWLLNLWTLFTAEPLRFFTYLFTAEPLKLSLLLNLWVSLLTKPRSVLLGLLFLMPFISKRGP